MTRLADLTVRPVAEWLAPPSDPARALRATAGSGALVGVWAGGGALIIGEPLTVSTDPATALADQPRLADPAPSDFVGGGWFGWIAFDGPSRLAFHDHVLRLRPDGWYFEALVSPGRDRFLQTRCEELATALEHPVSHASGWDAGPFAGADRDPHLTAVEQAIEAIRAGDVYQVSVCTRVVGDFAGSESEMFAAAVRELAPDYAAYLEGEEKTVVSLSPELFLRRRGREVTSAPIKGTAAQDADGRERLLRSVKDAAENVMIVDLVRNDLGSVAEIGSVTVPRLLAVEPHTGVWQLVSTVAARLADGADDAALLAATFPPGSVTGAPKSSALRILRAVEGGPRGVYTGAIGFASPSWGAEFGVAIRTFEIADGRIELGVGGGVTADSVPMLEWRECLDKAVPLLGAIAGRFASSPLVRPTDGQLAGGVLETILALDGTVLRLSDHLARLDRSCRELYGQPAPAGLEAELRAAAGPGRLVLRAIVAPVGRTLRATVTRASTPAPPDVSDVTTVVRSGGLWRHKWAGRSGYAHDEARLGAPLYLAPDDTVLETSRGNVFLVTPDGAVVTPPLRDDLLPGVTRRAVLDLARDTGRRHEIRAFTRTELLGAAAFWTSSVSLAVPIRSVDGQELPDVGGSGDLVLELRARLLSGYPTVR